MLKYLFLLFLLVSCSSGTDSPDDGYTIFEAGSGFEMLFDPSASKTVKEQFLSGTIVLNGSYFGVTDSGVYFPAGLWRKGNEEISPAIFDDPNITHVVSISQSDRKAIDIFPNSGLLTRKWGSDHDVFQAGPLVLSGNILQPFTRSWHARGEYERTLIGKTESGRIFFFVFTEKSPLPEVGAEVAKKFQNDPITLLNLDGGPSTAYYDGKRGFREDTKLPIIFRLLE